MLNQQLTEIYELLFDRFGPQFWWPGDSQFEIIVGAILTQNTNWGNVERALANLKQSGNFSFTTLLEMDQELLAEHIRPSGYYIPSRGASPQQPRKSQYQRQRL